MSHRTAERHTSPRLTGLSGRMRLEPTDGALATPSPAHGYTAADPRCERNESLTVSACEPL